MNLAHLHKKHGQEEQTVILRLQYKLKATQQGGKLPHPFSCNLGSVEQFREQAKNKFSAVKNAHFPQGSLYRFCHLL